MNLKNLSLVDCNFGKVDPHVTWSMYKPGAEPKFSGNLEDYYKYLIDNEVVGDHQVPVLIRVNSVENWAKVEEEGMKVMAVTGIIWGALINFECLVSLLKNPDIVYIEASRSVSNME